MAGDLAGRGLGQRRVTEAERPSAMLGEMPAAERDRPGIVVARDPDPVAPGHQHKEPRHIGFRQAPGARHVVEAVPEAEHRRGREAGDLSAEPVEGLGGLVGRQQRAAGPGDPL